MPPQRKSAPGQCALCGQAVDKGALLSHFNRCLVQQPPEDSPQVPVYVLEIKALPYWIWAMARTDADLADLDVFLRDLWVECCDHASAFTIGDEQYGNGGEEEEDFEHEMDVALEDLLEPKQSFTYDYDFGTSTSLELKVLRREEARQRDPVRLLARNDAPEIVCQECDNPATQICSECIWSGEGALCDDCAPEHACGEDALLPVVNSPRCGICAYTGPAAV